LCKVVATKKVPYSAISLVFRDRKILSLLAFLSLLTDFHTVPEEPLPPTANHIAWSDLELGTLDCGLYKIRALYLKQQIFYKKNFTPTGPIMSKSKSRLTCRATEHSAISKIKYN